MSVLYVSDPHFELYSLSLSLFLSLFIPLFFSVVKTNDVHFTSWQAKSAHKKILMIDPFMNSASTT